MLIPFSETITSSDVYLRLREDGNSYCVVNDILDAIKILVTRELANVEMPPQIVEAINETLYEVLQRLEDGVAEFSEKEDKAERLADRLEDVANELSDIVYDLK